MSPVIKGRAYFQLRDYHEKWGRAAVPEMPAAQAIRSEVSNPIRPVAKFAVFSPRVPSLIGGIYKV